MWHATVGEPMMSDIPPKVCIYRANDEHLVNGRWQQLVSYASSLTPPDAERHVSLSSVLCNTADHTAGPSAVNEPSSMDSYQNYTELAPASLPSDVYTPGAGPSNLQFVSPGQNMYLQTVIHCEAAPIPLQR